VTTDTSEKGLETLIVRAMTGTSGLLGDDGVLREAERGPLDESLANGVNLSIGCTCRRWGMGMATRFDPDRRRRRSIRLRGYDYGSPGAYFVTIVTQGRECLFGQVVNGEMGLNDEGQVARSCWEAIPDHFPAVELDAFVIMPNHVHGIIAITDAVRKGEASPEEPPSTDGLAIAGADPAAEEVVRDASPLQGPRPGSLGAIVGNFKSVTARRVNRMRGTPGAPVWQRNYYEHVVRNELALQAIRQYIADNPARWAWDTYNPATTGPDAAAVELWRLLQEGADG